MQVTKKGIYFFLSVLLLFYSNNSFSQSYYPTNPNGYGNQVYLNGGNNLKNLQYQNNRHLPGLRHKGPIKKKPITESDFDRYIMIKFDSIFSNHNNERVTAANTGNKQNTHVSYKDDFGGSIAYGSKTKYSDLVLEGEFSVMNFPVEDVSGLHFVLQKDISLWNLMGNAYYHYHNQSYFTPYLGLGLGGVMTGKTKDYAFGYQAMLGVEYRLDVRSDIILGYKFFGTTMIGLSEPSYIASSQNEEVRIHSHSIQIGYKYKF